MFVPCVFPPPVPYTQGPVIATTNGAAASTSVPFCSPFQPIPPSPTPPLEAGLELSISQVDENLRSVIVLTSNQLTSGFQFTVIDSAGQGADISGEF